MEMFIGQPDIFAFELKFEALPDGQPIVHFRMWAGKQSIGDFDSFAFLGGFLIQIESSISPISRRLDSDLFTAKKEHVFEILKKACYVGEETKGEIDDDVFASSDAYRDFELQSVGAPALDDVFVFLISGGKQGERLLWRSISGGEVKEAHLPAEAYENVARECVKICELEYQKYTKSDVRQK